MNKQEINKLLLILVFLNSFIVTSGQLSEKEKRKLASGDIIIDDIENESHLEGIQALYLLKGTRSEIWGVLNDFDNYKAIYGGIDSLKVHKIDSTGALVEFWADAVIKKIHFILDRHFDTLFYKISWYQVSGDMEIIEGGWDIYDSDFPDEKLVKYITIVKPKGIIQLLLIRVGAKRKVHSMVKDMRSWLENNRYLYQ